jgi:8-oxo-dGTP diphosphatase
MPFTYEYSRAALTVDCVVFGFDEGELKVLLIQRGLQPFKGQWALPGGFVRLDETLDEAARRELEEETGLKNVYLEQLYTFGAVERDPRERVVSVAYYALVKSAEHAAVGASDSSDAKWFPASDLPKLAFDHREVLKTALERLRSKQHLYEAVLQTELDKRNFRKKILSMGLIMGLDEQIRTGAHRPAQLFKFDTRKYQALKKRGFNFEI